MCILWEAWCIPIVKILMNWHKVKKPIGCAPCLSFWIGLIFVLYNDYNIFIPFYIYIQTIIIKFFYDRAKF